MTGVREAALRTRAGWRRIRFATWAGYLQAQMRLHGGRLVLDAPHGAILESFPRLRVSRGAEGDSTFTLKIGRGVRIGRDVELEIWAQGTNRLELGDHSFLMNNVHASLRSGSIRLGAHASLRTGVIVKSEGDLSFGDWSGISFGGIVHCAERIEVHDYAGTADRVSIVDSEKALDGSDTYFLRQPNVTKPVILERNVFVASNVVITAGTRVGRNSVIAAGAVLTGREYPAGWIIGGIPAKPIKALPMTEQALPAAER